MSFGTSYGSPPPGFVKTPPGAITAAGIAPGYSTVELAKQQVNAYLGNRQTALAAGYNEKTGRKFSNAEDEARFAAAAGDTIKTLKAGQYFTGEDGAEYAVVTEGDNTTPPGYTAIGGVHGDLANPYAVVDERNGNWRPAQWANASANFNGRSYDEHMGHVPVYTPSGALKVVRRGGGQAAAPAAPAAEFKPSDELAKARERAQLYSEGTGGGRGGRYGDDLIANINTLDTNGREYQRRFVDRFIPSLEANSRMASLEVGEAGRDALARLDPAVKPATFSDPFSDTTKIDDNSLFTQLQERIKKA